MTIKNTNEDPEIDELNKQINELLEQNQKLKEENNNLKQSKIELLQSVNPQGQLLNELNEYKEKYKELELKNSLLMSQIDETKKSIIGSQYVNNSVNILNEEESNKIKSEMENLQKQVKELENENKLIKAQNNQNKNRKCLTQSNNNSNFEEEYNDFDLANNANEKNNSEDMKIDYPGLNDINNKYEELKAKMEELKEIFKYIISRVQCEDPDLQQKAQRVCEIMEISLD